MTDRMGYQKAAGIKVEKRGPGRPAGPWPTKGELRRLYIKEKRSIRETALRLGYSKDLIARALKKYGIATRPRIRPSRLNRYGRRILKESIQKYGIRGTARNIGVPESTLRQYLKPRTPVNK